MNKPKIVVFLGTRPEAIKLAPIIKLLRKEDRIKTIVCSTGQHREMLKQVLDVFSINVDHELNLMKHNQSLFDFTAESLIKIENILNDIKPQLILVQGDTTTAFVSSLAGFYNKIQIGHVEAGLRSFNNFSPYPEEVNRRIISILSTLNFAPTQNAKDNLIREGIPETSIIVTGNTVIDAVNSVKEEILPNQEKIIEELTEELVSQIDSKRFILITMHRREKFGEEFVKILDILKELARDYSDYNFIYPVHLNPNVREPVFSLLSGRDNIIILARFIILKSRRSFQIHSRNKIFNTLDKILFLKFRP